MSLVTRVSLHAPAHQGRMAYPVTGNGGGAFYKA